MNRMRVLAAVAASCLLIAGPALAQVTGSVSGYVFDQSGAAVAGAVVKITGESMPAGRTVTTPSSGQYAFQLLQPGAYAIEVTKEGVGTSVRQTVVELDKNSTLDVVLGLEIREEILVTASRPVVDLTSAEVDTNFKRSTIEALPLERSYAGLFQLIPGVADNRSGIGPAAGGSRQDNTYLLDGVNITNPGYGYLSSEVNELDIQEVNVKRAGVSAEFGRTAGVVTNAVTRSGSNMLTGTARVDWLGKDLIGKFKSTAFRDSGVIPTVTPAIGLGGPIVKDRLFWYGSARYLRATLGAGRTNKLGTALPDSLRTGHELSLKITGNLGSHQIINIGVRDRPNSATNSGLGSGTSATVGSDDDNSARIATASWALFPASRTTVEVKYLYMKENNESTPLTDLGYLPAWSPTNLAAMGYYTDPTQANLAVGGAEYSNINNYRRHEAKATFTQYLRPRQVDARVEGGRRVRVRRGNAGAAVERLGRRVGLRLIHQGPLLLHPASAARPGAHLVGLRPGRHHDRLAADRQRRGAAQPRRLRPGSARQRRVPDDDCHEGRSGGLRIEGRPVHVPAVRLRQRGAAAPGVRLQRAEGQGGQGLRQLGSLLRDGPEVERAQPRASPHLPVRGPIRSRRQQDLRPAARFDDGEDDRSGHQADLQRRNSGRLRDAGGEGLEPRRFLHVSQRAQLHRRHALVGVDLPFDRVRMSPPTCPAPTSRRARGRWPSASTRPSPSS